MSENIELALQLLIVGMLSVFFILAIITGLARILIMFVNRYYPKLDDSLAKKKNTIEQKKVAVIASVVDLITNGKGVVQSIKKLN